MNIVVINFLALRLLWISFDFRQVGRVDSTASGAGSNSQAAPFIFSSGHIVEDPGGISHLVDVEVPTEYYYDKYALDLAKRHPHASAEILEHLLSLTVFLDILYSQDFPMEVLRHSYAYCQERC